MMDKVMSGHVADVGQQLAALPTRSVDLPTRPRCRVWKNCDQSQDEAWAEMMVFSVLTD